MSMLIDVIVAKGKEWPTTEIDGKWYIAKPMSLFSTRVGWVIEVLRGKAVAVHYKQDESPPRGRR